MPFAHVVIAVEVREGGREGYAFCSHNGCGGEWGGMEVKR